MTAFDPLRSLGRSDVRRDDTLMLRLARLVRFFVQANQMARLAATIAFLLVEAPLMLLSLRVEDGSLAWWLLAASAFALFLGFWAFVLWKIDTH
jgi:hypothetical protein